VDPQEIGTIVRRSAVVVVLLALAGALTAFAASRAVRPSYRSVGTLQVISPTRPLESNLGLQPAQIIDTVAALMTQPPLLDQVARDLKLGVRGQDLQSQVSVAPERDTTLIDVSVTDADANRAARIANTLMDDFVANVSAQNKQQVQQSGATLQQLVSDLQTLVQRDQAQLDAARAAHQDTSSLERQLGTDRSTLADVTSQYNAFVANQSQNLDSVRVITPARANADAVSPNTKLNTSLGAFAGLLVGLGLAVLLQYLDQGLRNEGDVRRKLGLPTLGVIPRYDKDSAAKRRRGSPDLAAEAYRRLRTNLLFSSVDKPVGSVLITSTLVGEGKSRSAANLAGVIAASGQRVLLVDGDMRRPAQHRVFNRPMAPGLSDLLLAAGRQDANGKALEGQYRTDHVNLWLQPCGTIPPNPSELLASRHTPPLLRALERQYDLVIVDSPPIDLVTDALSLGVHTSATLLIIESGRTNARQARHAVEQLRGVGANVVGVVLNKTRERDMRSYYYAYYAYGAAAQGAGTAAPPDEGDVASWKPVAAEVTQRRR
jgi:capsular exopolysaccharide synthesis family protein